MANVHNSVQSAGHCCSCSGSHSHEGGNQGTWEKFLPAVVSMILLTTGLFFDYFLRTPFFSGFIRLLWYTAAYLPVGLPVLKEAWEAMGRKDFFNEFSLMSVATLGAFIIGEYPEGVAVMLFYSVGELFQGSAVSKAQSNIKALLDVRPETATVLREGAYHVVAPEDVRIGETIRVKAGEKIPLDGTLLSASGSFNTSALTGESVPRTIRRGEPVLAGMLNADKVIEIRTEKNYSDSSLSKILEMVQNAVSRKAHTELLIRKFARIYTPVVFFLALAITVIPALFVKEYIFSEWLYRALVFLVISCPCALVVSVPLSYFAGIGAASRHGILFKGANFLETITRVNTVVMDKTGTLTEGVFNVQEVVSAFPEKHEWLSYVAALEAQSNHPVARAIAEYSSGMQIQRYTPENVQEIAGHGLKGRVEGHEILAGNSKLMKKHRIQYEKTIDLINNTVVIVAVDGLYAGYLIVADRVREDSLSAIRLMHREGIRKIVMLSGDKSSTVRETASNLGIDEAYGGLLPEDKMKHVERLKSSPANIVAFVGDGINDAPVLALSDIGIAMGGMGADAAIEIADVVIQTDQPSKIAAAIRIARSTRLVVVQNIILALGIKAAVLLLGALGIATMWEAVFADVGVSLIAILNAVRILKKKF